MDKTSRQDICPSCDALMYWGSKDVTVAGKTTVNVTTWHCKCGEAILKGDALNAWNRAYRKVRKLDP